MRSRSGKPSRPETVPIFCRPAKYSEGRWRQEAPSIFAGAAKIRRRFAKQIFSHVLRSLAIDDRKNVFGGADDVGHRVRSGRDRRCLLPCCQATKARGPYAAMLHVDLPAGAQGQSLPRPRESSRMSATLVAAGPHRGNVVALIRPFAAG